MPTKGGANQFADGFYAAQQLKYRYPEHFKTLTTTYVDFYDIGTDVYKFHMHAKHPVIK